MLGVGVILILKDGEITVKGIDKDKDEQVYGSDTREGWVESMKLHSYLRHVYRIWLYKDTTCREPTRALWSISGHEPLLEVHEDIRKVLEKNSGEPNHTTTIVDIMNLIGKCVVAGNVRRTEIDGSPITKNI